MAGTSAKLFGEEVGDAEKEKAHFSYLISSGGMHPSSSLLNTLRRTLHSIIVDLAILYFDDVSQT